MMIWEAAYDAQKEPAPEPGVTPGWLYLRDQERAWAIPGAMLVDPDGYESFESTGEATPVTITDDGQTGSATNDH